MAIIITMMTVMPVKGVAAKGQHHVSLSLSHVCR